MARSSSKDSNGNPRLTPIARRRVSDDVYDQIRSAIVERQFQPGERLDIPALAERFDVSQMPVRQAIGRLSDEGLVEIRPRSGTYVAELAAKDIAETFDIRRALERLAAETAIRNVRDDDLAALDVLVAEMDAQGRERLDRENHDRLNTEFHRHIIALAGNERLIEMYEQLNAHLRIARVHLGSEKWAARVEREQQEHRAIVDALRQRDAEALADALSRHIERSKKALISDIEAAEQKSS